MKKSFILAGALFLFTLAAQAQTQTPVVNARRGAQRARIVEGRKTGEITNGEAVALNAQQRSIRRTERRAKADGNVTPREKARITRKQNRANRDIRRAKHNEIETN